MLQITVVVPFGNAEPDAGLQTAALVAQLSLTVGANIATAVQTFGSVDLMIFAGQVMEGSWLSLTVTVKLQADGLPAASLTVQFTVVTPFGKVEPDAGVQTGVNGAGPSLPFGADVPGQLSLTVGAE